MGMNNNHYRNDYNWRGSKTENYPKSRSSRRPYFDRQLEEEFCEANGLTLKQVRETQKYVYLDDKILKWNDSAAKEAFLNAKERFYNPSCNLELPDCNIFIDKINWDSVIDPELILDLEKRQPNIPCGTENQGGGVVLGIPGVSEQYHLTSNGWGDDEKLDQSGNGNWRRNDKAYGGDSYDNWGWNNKAYGRDNRAYGSTWGGSKNQCWDSRYTRKLNQGDWNTPRGKASGYHYDGGGPPVKSDHGRKERSNLPNARRPSVWRRVPGQW